jgi:hypothetical protein
MRFLHLFEAIGGPTLVALSSIATLAPAQTVISNETLVTTTFVVNKTAATAKCGSAGCRAKTSMFAPISVICPAATAQTCTFHISLDTKTTISYRCGQNAGCFEAGPTGFYQFLVDSAAPTIGPTDGNGDYLFETNAWIGSANGSGPRPRMRQSYAASVLGAVTNSSSNNHTIVVNVGCSDTQKAGGCIATAHWSTMRVDVFEP